MNKVEGGPWKSWDEVAQGDHRLMNIQRDMTQDG